MVQSPDGSHGEGFFLMRAIFKRCPASDLHTSHLGFPLEQMEVKRYIRKVVERDGGALLTFYALFIPRCLSWVCLKVIVKSPNSFVKSGGPKKSEWERVL